MFPGSKIRSLILFMLIVSSVFIFTAYAGKLKSDYKKYSKLEETVSSKSEARNSMAIAGD